MSSFIGQTLRSVCEFILFATGTRSSFAECSSIPCEFIQTKIPPMAFTRTEKCRQRNEKKLKPSSVLKESCESLTQHPRLISFSLSSITSLPAGTLLPRGANFAMQSTIDFGMHFPVGLVRPAPPAAVVMAWLALRYRMEPKSLVDSSYPYVYHSTSLLNSDSDSEADAQV
jgi:hypothetical protein